MNATMTAPPGFEPIETSWGPMFLRTAPTCDLGDGLVGHYVRPPNFACCRPAIATVLQLDRLDDAPDVVDPGHLLLWAAENGIAVDFRTPGVGPRPLGLTIGITQPVEQDVVTNVTNGRPGRHTVVLRDGALFFDPSRDAMLWPNGEPPGAVRASDIEYVITLTRKDSPCPS